MMLHVIRVSQARQLTVLLLLLLLNVLLLSELIMPMGMLAVAGHVR